MNLPVFVEFADVEYFHPFTARLIDVDGDDALIAWTDERSERRWCFDRIPLDRLRLSPSATGEVRLVHHIPEPARP